MRRKQLAKRVAVAILSASMAFSMVPATGVFAASVTATDVDGTDSSKHPALDSAIVSAINSDGLTYSAETTSDLIKTKVENSLKTAGWTGSNTVVVTVAGPSASKLETKTDVNGGTTYSVTPGKLSVNISVTTSQTSDKSAVSENYSVDVPVDYLTTAEQVELVKQVAQNTLNAQKFSAEEKVNPASLVKKVNDAIEGITGLNASTTSDKSNKVQCTNVVLNSDITSTVSGKIVLTAGTVAADDKATSLDKKVTDDSTTFSVAREAAQSQLNPFITALDTTGSGIGQAVSQITIKDDTTAEKLEADINKAIKADTTFKDSGITATAVSWINKKDAEFNNTYNQQATVTFSDGTNTQQKNLTFVKSTSDDNKIAAAKAGIAAARKVADVTTVQKATDIKAADDTKVNTLVKSIVTNALTYKPDNKKTVGSLFNVTGTSGASVEQIAAKVKKYVPATATKEGTATVEVTYTVPNDDYDAADETSKATKEEKETFTLTFPTLKAKASKTLQIGNSSNVAYTQTTLARSNGKGSTEQFTAIQDGNDDLAWTSSNENVAVVDETGLVTYKGTGSTTITVTSTTNSKLTASISLAVAPQNAKFTDVQNPQAYYYNAVYNLSSDPIVISYKTEKDKDGKDVQVPDRTIDPIIAGTSDTTFSPNDYVTRGQFITFLWRAAGKPNAKKTSFTDIDQDSYYAKAVNWAEQEGIAKGTGNGTFNPNQKITRAEAAAFLYRAYGEVEEGFKGYELTFKDVADNAYYKDAVAWGNTQGLIFGTSVNTFSPNDNCTRAQAAVFINRAENFWKN